MAQFADGGIELKPVSRGNPDAGNAGIGEGFQELRKSGQGFGGNGNQVVDGAEDNGVGRMQKKPPGVEGEL